jgi:sulfur relay (sulfurtransferase) complex TusBCD TusD component (DsrE family)
MTCVSTIIIGTYAIPTPNSLTEFPRLCSEAVQSRGVPNELQQRVTLKNPRRFVFHCSFETRTQYMPRHHIEDAANAIGCRMLYQLMGGEWMSFANDRSMNMDPCTVLHRLAHQLNIKVHDMTVFLVVDGLHMLEDEPYSQTSSRYKCHEVIRQCINECNGAFIIACCCDSSATSPFYPVCRLSTSVI